MINTEGERSINATMIERTTDPATAAMKAAEALSIAARMDRPSRLDALAVVLIDSG